MKKLLLLVAGLATVSALARETVVYEGNNDRACNGCATCNVGRRPICEYDVITTKRKPALKHVEVSYSCPADCRMGEGKLVD